MVYKSTEIPPPDKSKYANQAQFRDSLNFFSRFIIFRSNKFVASHVANKLERIENIVNERIERFVEMPSITLTNVNSLIKTFKNRRGNNCICYGYI